MVDLKVIMKTEVTSYDSDLFGPKSDDKTAECEADRKN